MGQEGEEEEAAVDHSYGLVIHSAWRCWCMLDCEQVGCSRRSNSAEACLLCAVVVWSVCCSFKDVLPSIEEHHGAANVQSSELFRGPNLELDVARK